MELVPVKPIKEAKIEIFNRLKNLISALQNLMKNYSKRLDLFGQRLDSYRCLHAISLYEGYQQIQAKSDFYGYMKQTQKIMKQELSQLFFDFDQLKIEALVFINDFDKPCEYASSLIISEENIIQFPTDGRVSKNDLEVFVNMVDFTESIRIQINSKYNDVLKASHEVINQMRNQF